MVAVRSSAQIVTSGLNAVTARQSVVRSKAAAVASELWVATSNLDVVTAAEAIVMSEHGEVATTQIRGAALGLASLSRPESRERRSAPAGCQPNILSANILSAKALNAPCGWR